jgi:glycosyltransferase involved in cell wall biosynthesis
MASPTLQVTLECELPHELAVGGGTAMFVCGWCFCPEDEIRSLAFVIGDEPPQPVMAAAMPRLDPFRALHPDLDVFATASLERDPASDADPHLHSYRSGFWGFVTVPGPRPGATLELSLQARLKGGRHVAAPLASIEIVDPVRPEVDPLPVRDPTAAASTPRVMVCMATYNPAEDLFRRQIDSIRAQTYGNWACVISDDCSGPEGAAVLSSVVGDDGRFVVSRSPRRRGFYGNFERALLMAGPDVDFVALSDQDDIWHPDKLTRLVGAIGDAQLVYSDARVVARDGTVISDTWWSRRANNHSDLLSVLVANSITGAASLLRADLLRYALPFPPAQFSHFHDHWLGLTALSLGRVSFVDAPLYDYVQHGEASLGHAAANQMISLRERLRARHGLHERVAQWRLHYFADVCRLMQFVSILEMRCGPLMSPRKRRILRRFSNADESAASVLVLGLRGARELLRQTPETLGAEWMLMYAFLWRRMLPRTARDRPQARLRLDALPPTTLKQLPGRVGLYEPVRQIGEKIAPLHWMVSDAAPRRINVLIPTIDLRHFFGGYIAKLNLARRLVDAGERVRIVTVDPVGALAPDYRARLESYSGLAGLFDHVEVVFGREAGEIEVSADDRFVASTWWTAHIAHAAARQLGGERFLYLIQEYEPFTFPMGSYAALADQSYAFAHVALFSSELLRDYFRRHRIGVYAEGESTGDSMSRSFENAISNVPKPVIGDLRRGGARRLLFYARPEDHAARNMFELGVLALSRALELGAFSGGWEMHGIGTVEKGRRLALGGGTTLELLPRAAQQSYADVLRNHDVGLALMYTPHPSLVPLEMASAGMLTVTNSFENKTAAVMAGISTNLITVEPTVTAIAEGLREASQAVEDLQRRLRGSDVRWSRTWDRSFDDALLRWLTTALDEDRSTSVR